MIKKTTKKVAKTSKPKPKKDKGPLKYKFIRCTQGEHEFYCFVANAKDLNEVCIANQFDEKKNADGYQRAVSPARRNKISKFIDSGKPLPLSVLISFHSAEIDKANSQITIPRKKNAGWIIDGQHRLAGAKDAESEIMIPVVAFIGLKQQEQIDLFITINKEQKGVPTSLYYELLKKIPSTLSEKQVQEERAADIARSLRTNETSPFFNRIVSSTSPKRGQLSTTNFVRKLAPFLKRGTGRLYFYSDEERIGILNNLYLSLANVFDKEFRSENSIFFQTVGFGALMNVLPDLLEVSLREFGGFTVDDVSKLFKRIPEFDPTSWHGSGTGGSAELHLAEDLRTLLQDLKSADILKKLNL